MATKVPEHEIASADTVNLTGRVGAVQAREIHVERGGIGRAEAEAMTVSVTQGGIGAVAARHADITVEQGGIGALAAEEATIHDAPIAALAATKVNLSGNARVLFDLRAGIVAGLIAGVLLGAANALRHRIMD